MSNQFFKNFQVMLKHYIIWALLVCLFLSYTLNGQIQTKEQFLEQIATPESSLQWLELKKEARTDKATHLKTTQKLFGLNDADELKQSSQTIDAQNWRHYRYQQNYKGIPIVGAEYILHEKNDLIHSSNGKLLSGLDLEITPSYSEAEALEILLLQVGADEYAWENPTMEAMLQHQKEDPNASHYPKGELIIISDQLGEFSNDPLTYHLAYKFDIHSSVPFDAKSYYIEANTGIVIEEIPLFYSCVENGTAHTHYYSTQNIITEYVDSLGEYILKDCTRNIETYSAQNLEDNIDNSNPNNFLLDPDNGWSDNDQKSGATAHWCTEQAHDYFANTHNHLGYDNQNSKTIVYVDFGVNKNNASWGNGFIKIGEGDGQNFSSFATLDIVGHEFTHGVIKHTANLQYKYESGAINESLADIFGCMVEWEIDPTGFDWLLAEDAGINKPALRSMSNPNAFNDPDTYKGTHWYDGYNDNGGVHSNSGVMNHWFYLLAEGGTGTNDLSYTYNVSSIGKDKAANIAFNMLNYLNPLASFADARNASLQSATALYGAISPEYDAVNEAWCAVGVGGCGSGATGTITVLSPNGGEVFNQGFTYTINWSNTGNIGNNVKIEYSADAGNQWNIITENIPNDGIYDWIAPDNISTTIALLRVSSADNEFIEDLSDDYFVIQECNLEADFSPDSVEFCQNSMINFSDNSAGSPDIYEWYLGGTLVSTASTFPSELGDLLNLTYLRLSGNSLSGNIPLELGNLSNLISLNLTYNSLTGSIPPELGDLSNLQRLYLGHNSLSGNIPLELGNLSNLNYLSLVNNSLSGNIPLELGNLSQLEYLYLSNNSLIGNIPLELGNLSQLEYLPLGNNSLTGEIPSELSNLVKLKYLSLYKNLLSGNIPSEFSNLVNLEYLSLSRNSLSSIIPSELGNLSNINYLDLSHNSLSGGIPSDLGNLANLYYINLSYNQLTGCYPDSICSLYSTGNFSNNQGLPDSGSAQGFEDFCNGITDCPPTPVYPGDFNFDGVADFQDILSFGFYFGETGGQRSIQENQWIGHISNDWSGTQENGADLKHIDGNGDGIIDLRDTLALHLNLGETHPDSPLPPPSNVGLDSPIDLRLEPSGQTMNADDDSVTDLFFDIVVENTTGNLDLALYGGIITIDYSTSEIPVLDANIYMDSTSWLGTPGQDLFYIADHDIVNQQLHLGFTRIDHLDQIGNGAMARLETCIANVSIADSLSLRMITGNVSLHNSENFELPVASESFNFAIESPSSTLPFCQGFESETGWSQMDGDDGDWTRYSSSSGDHYMLYIGSFPLFNVTSSKTAKLAVADMYIPNDANSYKISFMYKMFGSSMNTLDLMAFVDNDLANPVLIWQKTGNQGNSWLSENINLDSYKGSALEFYFEGTTWSGYKGYLGVDDICIDIALPYCQGFETDIGWSQMEDDDGDWTRYSSSSNDHYISLIYHLMT